MTKRDSRFLPFVDNTTLLLSSRDGVVFYIIPACLSLLIIHGGVVNAAELELNATVNRQLQAVMDEKQSRTPEERKIDSNLLMEIKRQRDELLFKRVPSLRTGVEMEFDGTVLVDIKAEVTDGLLDAIENLDGIVISQFPQYDAVRARLPLDHIDSLAALPEVRYIGPAAEPIINKVNTSEGDVAHAADITRTDFGVDGAGVIVGVLSDGVDTLAARQATGDLPGTVWILPGQAGSGDEGTAMLEIVHDLAPGADLVFATALGGEAQFAQNILDLAAAGADIIVDDVFYFVESTFQDDIVAQAVEIVVADGIPYYSSAGNSGNLNDDTSGVYEGDFVSAGNVSIGNSIWIVHDFGGGNLLNEITKDPQSGITLQWSDPAGASDNDYDLFLITGNTVVGLSTFSQDGDDDPFEFIPSPRDHTGFSLLVGKKSLDDAPRYLHLNTYRGELAIATEGQTSGHAATENGFGVAAVDVATAGGGSFVGGETNPVETFSSDGPRRIFYEADGTPITPGNFLSTGGMVRQKPDIAAADGVATSNPAFNPFFGTSAAAPHGAAINALMIELAPGLSPLGARWIFEWTALDIEDVGIDRDSGVGIVMADEALDALDPGGCAAPVQGSIDELKVCNGEVGAVVLGPNLTVNDGADLLALGASIAFKVNTRIKKGGRLLASTPR